MLVAWCEQRQWGREQGAEQGLAQVMVRDEDMHGLRRGINRHSGCLDQRFGRQDRRDVWSCHR